MIKNPMKRCSAPDCRQFAEYGIRTHERCFTHKNGDDINLIESECSKCGKLDILIDGICLNFCHSSKDYKKYKIYQKHKENRVVELLQEEFAVSNSDTEYEFQSLKFNMIFDQAIEKDCGKERPDILIQLPTHNVIVEVDEFQHSKGYCKEGEINRMKNIAFSYGGTKCAFIRYNPDSYVTSHEHSQNYQNAKREKALLKWIKHLIEFENNNEENKLPLLSVVYLFYDGYNKVENYFEEIELY
jgi:hypothetical protein